VGSARDSAFRHACDNNNNTDNEKKHSSDQHTSKETLSQLQGVSNATEEQLMNSKRGSATTTTSNQMPS
jgi:hypothetical protein